MEDDGGNGVKPESNQRFYLISGIYHPKPSETHEIEPDKRWDILDRQRLEEINGQLKGKAITANHPFDTNGVPVLIEEYGSNYRGKVIHSRILEDGRGYFIAKIPINNSIKSKLFKKMLKDKTFSELSLTHEFVGDIKTGDGYYIPNHIALLKQNEARRPGCKILEILKMPKKRHGNIKSVENDLNLFKQIKKNIIAEKQNRFLSIASVLDKRMESQQTPLQDDIPASSSILEPSGVDAAEPTPEIVEEIIKYTSDMSKNDMANIMARNLSEITKRDLMLEEMSKKLAEFEKSQQEARKKQVEILRDDVSSSFAMAANADFDHEAPPLTEEAKKKNVNTITEIIDRASSIDDPDPIARKEKIIKEFDNLARAISVASKEGAEKIAEQTKMLRENSTILCNPGKVSSFASRFAYKRQRHEQSDVSGASTSAEFEKKAVQSTLDPLKALREGQIQLFNSRVSKLETLYDKSRQLNEGTLNFKKAALSAEFNPLAPRTSKSSISMP